MTDAAATATGEQNAAQSAQAQSQTAQTQTGQQNQTAAQIATAPYDYSKAIGPDGKFQEGWKAGLPEDIREELCLDAAQSFPELAKQYVNAQKMIGKNKVVLPTEKSSPSEWDAFYAALGRPKTADGYQYKPPTDVVLFDMTQESVQPMLAELHKAGYTQKQVDVAVGQFTQAIQRLEKSLQDEEQRIFEESEQAIVQESGEALEELKHDANLLLAQELPDEGKRAKLVEALNDNELRPHVFGFLAQMYRKYCAPSLGIQTPQGQIAMTPSQMRQKAQELMAEPGYVDGTMKDKNPAGFNRLTDEITALYNAADKAEKVKK
jgi:hypothetical protein